MFRIMFSKYTILLCMLTALFGYLYYMEGSQSAFVCLVCLTVMSSYFVLKLIVATFFIKKKSNRVGGKLAYDYMFWRFKSFEKHATWLSAAVFALMSSMPFISNKSGVTKVVADENSSAQVIPKPTTDPLTSVEQTLTDFVEQEKSRLTSTINIEDVDTDSTFTETDISVEGDTTNPEVNPHPTSSKEDEIKEKEVTETSESQVAQSQTQLEEPKTELEVVQEQTVSQEATPAPIPPPAPAPQPVAPSYPASTMTIAGVTLNIGAYYGYVSNDNIYDYQAYLDAGYIGASFGDITVNDGGFSIVAGHNPGVMSVVANNIYDGAVVTVSDRSGNVKNYTMSLGWVVPQGIQAAPGGLIDMMYNPYAYGDVFCIQFCRNGTMEIWIGR